MVDGWIGRHDSGVRLQATEGAAIVAEVRELLEASGRPSTMVAPTSNGLYAFHVGHYHSSGDGSVVERHDLELRAGDKLSDGARELVGLISQDVVVAGAAGITA